MSNQRHRRRSQGGTSPETTPQTGSGVAHFSVSALAQYSMSVDIAEHGGGGAHHGWLFLLAPLAPLVAAGLGVQIK